MNRIKLDDIEKKQHLESYEQLCRYIYQQVDHGVLKPIRASGTNGKKPALYREYRLAKPDADHSLYHIYEEELLYRMCTEITTDYYLRHLDQYEKDRPWVLKLNEYLLARMHMESVPMISKNERSFQIWGREKFLQAEQGKKILKRCGMELSQLSFYETSQPLAYYSHHRKTPQNMLIVENKDTFYSLRLHLMEGCETVFGVPFGTLIYGAGKGILRSFEDFSFCVEPYMRAENNQIYYFGDLDYEGIGIFERLAEAFAKQNPPLPNQIKPFVKAYEQMLDKAQDYSELPKTKENQNRRLSGYFFSFFHNQTISELTNLLESERYIPQEILNISDFKQSCMISHR